MPRTYRDCAVELFNSPSMKPHFSSGPRLSRQERYVCPIFGDLDIRRIRTSKVREAIRYLRECYCSHDYTFGVLSTMRVVFQYAADQHYIPYNPCPAKVDADFYDYNDFGGELSFPLTPEDHRLLTDSFQKLPLCNLYGFCYTTGSSFTNAFNIRCRDIHFEESTVSITRRSRTEIISLSGAAMRYLKAESAKHISPDPDDPFFLNPNGSRASFTTLKADAITLQSLLENPLFLSTHVWNAYPRMMEITERSTGNDQ